MTLSLTTTFSFLSIFSLTCTLQPTKLSPVCHKRQMSTSNSKSNSTLYIAAAAILVAGAAGVYYFTTTTTAQPSKTSDNKTKKTTKKKKSKKSKKNKSEDTTKEATPTASPTKATPPAAAASSPSTTPTTNAAPPAVASPSAVATQPKADGTDVERDANGLQIAGTLSMSVILEFFKNSDKLLGQQTVKDDLAAAYKNGENILDTLKHKQEQVWASLQIEAQFGFRNIQNVMTSADLMTTGIRDALVKAAQMEEVILSYAILGSQEKFEQDQAKLKMLSERGQSELDRELQQAMGQGQMAMQQYTQRIMGEFQAAYEGFEGLDEIGRLKQRQQLSDKQYIAIVKGQMLQHLMMRQQQQPGVMQ